jgi:hypothetical protein
LEGYVRYKLKGDKMEGLHKCILKKDPDEEYEWECEECGNRGDYADIRKPFDRGVDTCPQCSTEVTCVE